MIDLSLFDKIPIERKWYKCPNCNKNLIVYDNTASCHGFYIKCKQCGNEVEIKK